MTSATLERRPYNPAGPRCGAKLKTRPGETCPNPPLTGATRCRMHGSSTKAAKAKAAREVARANAARAAITYGYAVEIDPTDALLGELARAHGVVLWLEAQVQGLRAGDVAWGLLEETEETEDVGAGPDPGTNTKEGSKRGAAVHVLVQLYGQERDRLVKVAAECRKAGVEQAVTDRVKAMAVEFTGKLEAVLRALGHDPTDPAVLRLVALALRGPAILEGDDR